LTMYLFFDVETADAPPPKGTLASDTLAWPRLVQIAWVSCDKNGRETQSRESIIRPSGFKIAPGAAAVHGINTAIAMRDGVALEPVLAEFSRAVRAAEVLVAHNYEFDKSVLAAEFTRIGQSQPFDRRRHVCTMVGSADYCKLPGNFGKYKWPKLAELHRSLFGEPFEGAHSALADTRACMRCYFRLTELGVAL